jgi:predicted dehydrogenase
MVQQRKAGSPRLRFGLIGVGKHGRRYAQHIRVDLPDLELVAVARRDRAQGEAAARELGCRFHADYRQVIEADDVDAIIVAVPPSLHGEIVGCAARAGRPVLLEKPAAINLEVGRRILADLRRYPVPIMVAQTLRYNAIVRALLAACAQIGPIHSINLSQRFEPSRLSWLDDPAQSGGGIALHTGVHSFDLLRLIAGSEPESVFCRMQRIQTQRTDDGFAATLSFAGGSILATLSQSRTAPGRAGHIEIAGERATLKGDHVLNHAWRVIGTTAEPIDVGPPLATVRDLLRDFADHLRSNEPMPIPFEEGLRAVAMADACYRSAASGQMVSVEAI